MLGVIVIGNTENILNHANNTTMMNDGFPFELFTSSTYGDIPAVDGLRKSGVDIIGSRMDNGMSSILIASRNGHTGLLEYLLEQGADANDKEYYGGTCLMAAACYRQPDCVRLLIDAGANTKYAYSGDNATVI